MRKTRKSSMREFLVWQLCRALRYANAGLRIRAERGLAESLRPGRS